MTRIRFCTSANTPYRVSVDHRRWSCTCGMSSTVARAPLTAAETHLFDHVFMVRTTT
jgi:hypothetical protein